MATLFDSGIRPAIDEYLLNKSKERRSYGDYWSASSAGYCMRKNMFERLGVPYVTEDARKTRVFASGHIFHEWIQGITKGAGLSIAQELELQDDKLMIRGHIDDLILIRYDENGETPVTVGSEQRATSLILYDYKTAHSRSFTYSKDRPMGHYHTMQLGTYMYMLRGLRNDGERFASIALPPRKLVDLTEARRLSISKDDLRMDEKQLLWSGELEEKIVDYWTTLNKYWKSKKFPKCTCADNDGAFMASEKYNPYYKYGEPCSIKYYEEWKNDNKE